MKPTINELNEVIAVKMFGHVKGVDFGVWEGHDLQKNKEGEPDVFAFDVGNHNGYRCIRCAETFCIGCDDDHTGKCYKEVTDYTTVFTHELVLSQLIKQYIVNIEVGDYRNQKYTVTCTLGHKGEHGLFIAEYYATGDSIPLATCMAAYKHLVGN